MRDLRGNPFNLIVRPCLLNAERRRNQKMIFVWLAVTIGFIFLSHHFR